MRKLWPAKRQRVRLGAGKIEEVPAPTKKRKRKKEKKPEVTEEKPEEVKEEEPQTEVSAETAEEEQEKTETSEPSGEKVQETFGVIDKERIEGTVKFFNPNKGFGFITGDDGKEYYVNESAVKEGVTIEAEDKVSFKAAEGDKGPVAEDVEKIWENK